MQSKGLSRVFSNTTAQGDFARTSDGYANSLRQLETNMESLKANVGKTLLPIISEAVTGINDMIGALTQSPPRTVLDDFADIDLQTDKKLAEINATATEAHALADTLGGIADEANKLQSQTYRTWRGFLTALSEGGHIDLSKTGKSIGELANALNGNDPNTDRAKAWQELLGALSADVEGLSKLTGMSSKDTTDWLTSIANAANELSPDCRRLEDPHADPGRRIKRGRSKELSHRGAAGDGERERHGRGKAPRAGLQHGRY